MDRPWRCRLLSLSGLLLVAAIATSNSRAADGYGSSLLTKAPPLAAPAGKVARVATVNELLDAIEHLESGGTIVIKEGRYRLPRPMVLRNKTNVTLRGSARTPGAVVLTGNGWESTRRNDDILHIGKCDGVIVADLTFADCRSYGIKVEAEKAPRNIQIYHCHFRDIGVRAIKGSAGQDMAVRAVNGSVRYCTFENTKVPPADWLFGGDYISAIDMMALENWTFSDNSFRSIKGRNGGGRAAIFIWVRSRNVVVERNLIVDCDRGIAFGNPGQSTANLAGERLTYVSDGVIRNNFIAGGSDCGIEVWHSRQIEIYNNSIWRGERNFRRGIRLGTGTSECEVVNNLVHGEILQEGAEAKMRNNVTGRIEGWFRNPRAGDLTLTEQGASAVDTGEPLAGVIDDIRREPRKGQLDLGAWESGKKP